MKKTNNHNSISQQTYLLSNLTFKFNLIISLIILGTLLLINSSHAANRNTNPPLQGQANSNYNTGTQNLPKSPSPAQGAQTSTKISNADKIINEYKNYLKNINPKLRQQIVQYRKKMAAINKQKRELYRRLSNEAQLYLIKEQEYKQKLEQATHERHSNSSPAVKQGSK